MAARRPSERCVSEWTTYAWLRRYWLELEPRVYYRTKRNNYHFHNCYLNFPVTLWPKLKEDEWYLGYSIDIVYSVKTRLPFSNDYPGQHVFCRVWKSKVDLAIECLRTNMGCERRCISCSEARFSLARTCILMTCCPGHTVLSISWKQMSFSHVIWYIRP